MTVSASTEAAANRIEPTPKNIGGMVSAFLLLNSSQKGGCYVVIWHLNGWSICFLTGSHAGLHRFFAIREAKFIYGSRLGAPLTWRPIQRGIPCAVVDRILKNLGCALLGFSRVPGRGGTQIQCGTKIMSYIPVFFHQREQIKTIVYLKKSIFEKVGIYI